MSVAWWLRRTGLLRVLESFRRQPRLLVLNYHRIGEIAGNQLDDATFSATADQFREQVRYLKQWFAVPSADKVLESLERGSFSNPTVLITFDDGYRDNYELAFPILRELGVPACFFVVTGLLDAPTLPWWDRVAYTIKMMKGLTFEISYPEPLTIDLREVSRASATWRVLRACKEARSFDEQRFSDELATRTGVSVDARTLARRLFMSWESVREMAGAGMAIGSHTVTHSVLASLSESAQRRELQDSRRRIAEAVGSLPGMLAYPVGGPRSFTSVTRQLALEAGYRAAFSYGGVTTGSWPLDPLSIPRTAVEYSDTVAQFRLRSTLATIQVPQLFQQAAARFQSRNATKRNSLPGYT